MIHQMLLQVEEGVLHLEKLTIEALRENARLRQRVEVLEQKSLR